MKVILQKNVPNLGDAGEVKDVADGYARNYLLPRKLVVAAVGNSTRALEHQQRLIAARSAKRMAEMTGLSDQIKALGTLELPVRVGSKGKLFGSVTSMQVAAALQEKGFDIEKRKVELGEAIRNLGSYQIRIRLAEKLIVSLAIQVVPDAASESAAAEAALELEEIEKARAAQMAASQKPAEAAKAAVEGVVSDDDDAEPEVVTVAADDAADSSEA